MKGRIYRRTHRDEVAAGLCERAMVYWIYLLGVGRATTEEETIIAQVFRWNFLSATGGWAIIDPSAEDIERYEVPEQFRYALGKYIFLMSEKHFADMWRAAWNAIWKDRNTRMHSGGQCKAAVPVVGISHAQNRLAMPCECDILLKDLVFGGRLREVNAKGKAVGFSQGLIGKINRMAITDPSKIGPATWVTSLRTMRQDKHRSWSGLEGGPTKPEKWPKEFGITDPISAELLVRLGKEAGYPEPKALTTIRKKLIDDIIRPYLGWDVDIRTCVLELDGRISQLRQRCGETWFEENVMLNLRVRDRRTREIPLDGSRGDDDDRSLSEEVVEVKEIDEGAVELEELDVVLPPGEEVPMVPSVQLKAYFFTQMDIHPREKAEEQMRRALRQLEQATDQSGLAAKIWTDEGARKELHGLIRRWRGEWKRQGEVYGVVARGR